MTATPPLAQRVVRLAIGVMAIVLVVVNLAVFFLLRERLHDSVDGLLAERATLVRAEADTVRAGGGGAEDLARALQARGLRVVVRAPGSEAFASEPASPVVGLGLPAPGAAEAPARSLVVRLDGGAAAEVFTSTSGVTDTLRQLVLLQTVASLGALLLAAVLLRQASRRALRPVVEIAAAATRTAEGQLGERLRPDRPTTELGRMAVAYDTMLDELESSLAEANDVSLARSLLAAVVEGSTDAIAVQDLDGTILTWNTAAEGILGWSAEHAVGRHMALAVPPEELPRLTSLVAEVVADGGVRGYEGERLTRGGSRLPVSVRLSPVRDDLGSIVAVAVGARDVTEQRWLSATLDATLAALQTAAEEATASEEATRRFLADAAHQLRTPVAGIRACAETLLMGASSEDAERLLATMVRETSRAARLIASLLRIARLDHGVPLAREPIDVVAICADEVERLSLLSPDLDVRLEAVGPLGEVLADRAACQEILSNLGDNARRHAGGRIVLAVRTDGEWVQVRVDDGAGLEGAAQADVFERFVSLDGQGGSGLGLPIGRALAVAMQGNLRYDAGFVLSLPAAASAAAGEPETAADVLGGSDTAIPGVPAAGPSRS